MVCVATGVVEAVYFTCVRVRELPGTTTSTSESLIITVLIACAVCECRNHTVPNSEIAVERYSKV